MFVVGVALSILLGAAILIFWSGRRARRLLAKIPRPPGLPLIGHVLQTLGPVEDIYDKIIAWTNECGPIFLLNSVGIVHVILSGPAEIQILLNSQEHIQKERIYNFLQPWIGTGLLTGSGDKWRSRRKLLNPAFHYKILEDFVPVFNANSVILVDKLRGHTQDDYVEIGDYITLCTLDIICETMMGTSVHAQEGGEVQYIRAVKRICEICAIRHVTPWLHIDFIYRISPLGREEKKVVKVLQDFSGNVIKRKREEHLKMKTCKLEESGDKKSLSLLDMLLEMSDQDGMLSDDDIREEVNTFMFAGHDTTAAAISFALFLLGAHQDIQDKVVLELSDIFGSDRRDPTIADLQNMTYMDMVIKESLRLYPSVSMYGRCTTSDLKIGDYTIPSGYSTFVSAFIVHRNPDIYPEPERFDPERFSPEHSAGRHPCAYIPFSTGPRNCIGQKFARLEEKCVLSYILRNFKLESLDYKNMKVMPGVVLKPKVPLKIKISTRVCEY